MMRAALGYGAPVLVWLPNVVAYLAVGEKVLLEDHIGIQDAFGHASFISDVVDQGPYHLIETFVNVDTGCSDRGAVGSMVLHFKLGEVPAFFCSCTWNACIHFRFSPTSDPLVKVFDPDGGPRPVDN